jgi:hypothetical protein
LQAVAQNKLAKENVMAIQGSYNFKGQLVIPTAYVKVSEVHGGKHGYSCRVAVFASKTDSDSGLPELVSFSGPQYEYQPDECPIKLAYAAVKADEQFNSFVDV